MLANFKRIASVEFWIMHLEMALKQILRALRWVVELIGTLLYREMLKRNTLQPLKRITAESDPERRRRLLRDFAQTKSNESSYIQLAVRNPPVIAAACDLISCNSQGGFLFTTVASCLQWPGTANGHWSAPALLYASILLALGAIVTGSQQLLLLPNERQEDRRTVTGVASVLPQQVLLKPVDRIDSEMETAERQHLKEVVGRICDTPEGEELNYHQIFALQTPIMLLALAVVTFVAAMCSVVFAPLATEPVWGDNAKVCNAHIA